MWNRHYGHINIVKHRIKQTSKKLLQLQSAFYRAEAASEKLLGVKLDCTLDDKYE